MVTEKAAPDYVQIETGELIRREKAEELARLITKQKTEAILPDFRPLLCDLRNVELKPVSWLWPGWIPREELSLVTGDPDAGKTYALLDIAAALTKGSPFPDGVESTACRVLYLDGDNGEGELKRRLEAMGCGFQNFRLFSQVEDRQGQRIPFLLRSHLQVLESILKDFAPAWIVIDPLVSFHRENEIDATSIRSLLTILINLARAQNLAVTIIQHPNKSVLSPDLYRIRGSLDFVAAPRAVLKVIEDKENNHRILYMEKLNLAPKPQPLGFNIEERKVTWLGPCELPHKQRPRDKATEFLQSFLADGPKPQKDIEEQAQARGLSTATIRRAKNALNIKSCKVGFDQWMWELPQREDAHFSDEPVRKMLNSQVSHEEDAHPIEMSPFPMAEKQCEHLPHKPHGEEL